MSVRVVRVLTISLATLALGMLLGVASASAATRHVEVPSRGPGPDQFDSIPVHQYGPSDPERVLVLLAGTNGGAGNFTLVAKDLVKRVPGLAVWSVDRRSQVLEDTEMYERALAGEVTPDEAWDYYLGWLTNGGNPVDHYDFLDTTTVPFAKRWGMKVALKDARQVVKVAREEGAEVFLGGHSLGASLAAAYAAWDFNEGRAGYRDLAGIVLIDGGLLGSFDSYNRAEAEEQVASLETQPFLDLLGIGIPEAAGLFAEAGGVFARRAPDAPGTTLYEYPLLPPEFKPPVLATNEAALAYAFDRDTSPPNLALLHVNAGRLAKSGSPRGWKEGGVTPAANVAKGFAQEPANGVEWFFPRRLTIDTNGADRMKENAVADYLGLRLFHTDEIDIPIYAFQTDLTDGSVLAGAEALVKRAETKGKDAMLVDGDPAFSHLDPLLASPSKNKFAKTVAKFLKR